MPIQTISCQNGSVQSPSKKDCKQSWSHFLSGIMNKQVAVVPPTAYPLRAVDGDLLCIVKGRGGAIHSDGELDKYQVYARFILIDTVTGYRSQSQDYSTIISAIS